MLLKAAAPSAGKLRSVGVVRLRLMSVGVRPIFV